MVTVTLENGEEYDHGKVRIEKGLVIAYEVDEDAPARMANTGDPVAVYPDSSVLKVDIGDEEHLVETVKDRIPDEYKIESS